MNERSDNEVVLAVGANIISFAAVGGNLATPYAVIPFAYKNDGNWQPPKITARTAAGFTITVANVGKLDYIVKRKTS